jgi:hypothetical protein
VSRLGKSALQLPPSHSLGWGLVWLYLFLSAEWTPELAEKMGMVVAMLVGVCVVADVALSLHWWHHGRKEIRGGEDENAGLNR